MLCDTFHCETFAVAHAAGTVLLRQDIEDLCSHSIYRCLIGCKVGEEQ